MRFLFDESGDFAFREGEVDVYVHSAVICPDSRVRALTQFVDRLKTAWGVPELHAYELDDEQLLAIAIWIGRSDVQLLASATDSEIVNIASIQNFRLDQAAILKANLDTYVSGTEDLGLEVDPKIISWMNQRIKRSGLAAQISHQEFIHAFFLQELISDALQKSLMVFMEDKWRDDFESFRFIVDAKLDAKLSSGEKYLESTIVPALGSRPSERLGIVDTWQEEPVHPFVERFGASGVRVAGVEAAHGFDLRKVFENGIEFKDSKQEAGLQIADFVAHVVRRAILNPADPRIQQIYESIKPKLRHEDQGSIRIQRLNVATEAGDNVDRYRHVAGL